MSFKNTYDKVVISTKSRKIIQQILDENPRLKKRLETSNDLEEFTSGVRRIVEEYLSKRPHALQYYKKADTKSGHKLFLKLEWKDYAAIRILDYLDHAGEEYDDLNLRDRVAYNHPFEIFWLGYKYGTGGGNEHFFEDMLHLFRQYNGVEKKEKPSLAKVKKWMKRHPSGLDPQIVKLRDQNKLRIIEVLVDKIDSLKGEKSRYTFPDGIDREEKITLVNQWWNESAFHLKFAVRTPEDLNEMLGHSLDPRTIRILKDAKEAGIPFFVNPYYLSLLNVKTPEYAVGGDLAIKDYVIYSRQLINEFGKIVAWEKEDIVKPGEPNAAGWLLPSEHNLHRRYPEVAILIPDTVGRACGGLCVSCQRMYDFQKGHLNFNLDKLKPKASWKEKLAMLMDYFEKDSQLRDILITGGDALMSSDKSIQMMLDSVYKMAKIKKAANKRRKNKYAEMVRIRLGTRLPAYLPQRVTPELTEILADFKKKASEIGFKQFVIQTHYESPMEITPEAKLAIDRLISAGWTVTNQHVFTTASSRRGHAAKLRKVLNEVGVLPYYTFTVKGYKENKHNFATSARAVQEQLEEKVFGKVSKPFWSKIRSFPERAESMVYNLSELRKKADLPFIATDRNVLNLPGVGKSLTFRVIGITRYGRRILQFDHDQTRVHSPIIHKMGKVTVIESKAISEYLSQVEAMGEDIHEYEAVYGYSMGDTEPRMPVYEYPEYDFETTEEITNLKIN